MGECVSQGLPFLDNPSPTKASSAEDQRDPVGIFVPSRLEYRAQLISYNHFVSSSLCRFVMNEFKQLSVDNLG
jgi:hypothetical protein